MSCYHIFLSVGSEETSSSRGNFELIFYLRNKTRKEKRVDRQISDSSCSFPVSLTYSHASFLFMIIFSSLDHVGFIVGAVDEMLQTLDDNAMNLQSMTASRFVGPFLDNVQKWEKSLSHISEVVEVCIIL